MVTDTQQRVNITTKLYVLLARAIAGWNCESAKDGARTPLNKQFTCRFLVKPPEDQDQTVEEKQQRNSQYECMQVSRKDGL